MEPLQRSNASGDLPPRPAESTIDGILQSFNTWAFKREQPSDAPLLRATVATSLVSQQPLKFVLYWGKGPRHHVARPDLECLDYLKGMLTRATAAHPHGAALELILTDTHAELNGHSSSKINAYFDGISRVASDRGFTSVRLGQLVAAFRHDDSSEVTNEPSTDLLEILSKSASKWHHGTDMPGSAARHYYRQNMFEKRAVGSHYTGSVFVTFNNSKVRELFPDELPIFYMYSLRKGVAVKPWFMDTDGHALMRAIYPFNDHASGLTAAE